MIATRRLWRWRKRSDNTAYVEVTEPGDRADWVTEDHVYYTLGWVREAP